MRIDSKIAHMFVSSISGIVGWIGDKVIGLCGKFSGQIYGKQIGWVHQGEFLNWTVMRPLWTIYL